MKLKKMKLRNIILYAKAQSISYGNITIILNKNLSYMQIHIKKYQQLPA